MQATRRRHTTRYIWSAAGFRTGAILLLLSVTLAGCGKKDESGAGDATIAAPTANAADADVTSGCWKASDRTQSPTQAMQWKQPPAMIIDPTKHYTATLTTNKGSFVVELYPDDAPKTVNNFVCLAKAGYYANSPFHRILAGFVIQGGDPTGTGGGGPGYQFADEPITRDYELGTLAMANAGPNTNGSQFFVIVGPAGEQLPKNYTIFGKVTSGMDVVNTIAKTPTKDNGRGEQSAPLEPIVLQQVTIAES
jgi:cyclophilin family peptidyl-prolyl cis-trans isomerase